jgi:hypothetical protein
MYLCNTVVCSGPPVLTETCSGQAASRTGAPWAQKQTQQRQTQGHHPTGAAAGWVNPRGVLLASAPAATTLYNKCIAADVMPYMYLSQFPCLVTQRLR